MLPKEARYAELASLPKGADLGKALVEAMNAVEKEFASLSGQLPRDYERFDNSLLENLLKAFDSETLRTATGDVFGRIYEYFLMKFAMQGAQDNGEFFTPPSLVQTIVNVIEPEHGVVFDPACGSGGMFVQSSHFIEENGEQTSHKVTFYGQEKSGTTIRLAKMNLAVHGLEGDIREANTFYQDEHNLFGKCDFVMSNPPFNVDEVNAERVKDDRRLPFSLPGVNKAKKVSNGNYLWISYFYSYLEPKGRAGFVMSSQASSAGHGEAEVRRKIVETGDVDVMIAIRANFFYTRTVPCELWHFDKGKPPERADQVLMVDARNVYRKVTRKVYDFSPEQLANLTAIVWLYRGQQERFIRLMIDYFLRLSEQCANVRPALQLFRSAIDAVREPVRAFSRGLTEVESVSPEKKEAIVRAVNELVEAEAAYHNDRRPFLAAVDGFRKRRRDEIPATNSEQHEARLAFDPIAEQMKGLVKQIDFLYKLASRAAELVHEVGSGSDDASEFYDRKAVTKSLKQLDEARKGAVEELKQTTYLHRQIQWLQDRFPEGKFRDVAGLCRVVSRAEIAAADFSLTPGRYVGVAPAEIDEDFDFGQALRDIHVELADLTKEACALAAKIQKNFEELGV